MLEKIKKNKKEFLFCGIFFLIAICLVYLFPYSGDDWAWGSSIGIDRLNKWFDNYNGRYAGNLLVLALTRSNLLKTTVIAMSLTLFCILSKLYYKSNYFSVLVFGGLLTFLIPKQIFVQSIVWTAGFSNYVPPILLTIIYFVIIRNIFDDEVPKYKHFVPILVFLMGFVGSLFMENLTLYNVAISAIIIVFVYIKFKKFYLTHIAFFAGSLVGTIGMFTNSVYGLIASSNDTYRSTAMDEGLKNIIPDHINQIYEYLFTNNILILFVITALVGIVTVKFIKNSQNKKLKSASFVSLFVNFLTLGLLLSKNQFTYWSILPGRSKSELLTIGFFFVIAALYCLSVLFTTIICVTDKKIKFKLLLILISVPIIVAPLLVVNPIGPRCFFPPYFMLMIYALGLFAYLIKDVKTDDFSLKCFNVAAIASTMALVIFLFSIYSTIHFYDVKRSELIDEQIANGQQEITVVSLPYKSYVWMGDPKEELWENRYKLFNGIDKDIKFEFVPFNKLEKIMTKE